ncbi:hypothetical protein BUE80_DR012000 [Diplocarpon rosae]|nr:hypothetical protein BUE80_DR012000 [Diplocarpon rosae]
MKLSVFTPLAFAVLCSGKLFCDNGVYGRGLSCGEKSLYCCREHPTGLGNFYNGRKGCGDPIGGPKQSCGGQGLTYCCNS